MISVVIPTFNRSKQLLRAVESVFRQSYRNFELIVVDDGSTENLQHIAELVRDRGHVFMRTENKGVAEARNFGVAHSRGDWVSFLDSDDCWKPDKLKQQVEFHRKNPEINISQCEEIWIRKGKRVNKKRYHEMLPEGEAFNQCLKLCCISPSAVMVNKELFKEKGGFDKRLTVCEDYDLWLRVTVDNEVGLIKHSAVEKYGGHDDQLSRSEPAMDRFRVFALLKLIMAFDMEGEKLQAALVETSRKAGILFQGALKRQVAFADVFKRVSQTAQEAVEKSLDRSRTRSLLDPVFSDFAKVALLRNYPSL